MNEASSTLMSACVCAVWGEGIREILNLLILKFVKLLATAKLACSIDWHRGEIYYIVIIAGNLPHQLDIKASLFFSL